MKNEPLDGESRENLLAEGVIDVSEKIIQGAYGNKPVSRYRRE